MSALIRHKENLAKVCRVCGEPYKQGSSKSPRTSYDCKGKDAKSGILWHDKLLRYCSVDVSGDNENIHPPRFCCNCHRFMKTCAGKEACGKTWKARRNLAIWHPHNGPNPCSLCEKYNSKPGGPGRKKKVKTGRPKASAATVCLPPMPDKEPCQVSMSQDETQLESSDIPSTSSVIGDSNDDINSLSNSAFEMDDETLFSNIPEDMDLDINLHVPDDINSSLDDLLHGHDHNVPSSRYDKDLAATQITEAHLCPLCHNIIDNPIVSATCTHVFCSSCINAWVLVCQYCPVCRESLMPDALHKCHSKVSELIATIKMKCDCEESYRENGIFLDNWLEHISICKHPDEITEDWKCDVISKWKYRNKLDQQTQTEEIKDNEKPTNSKVRKRAPGGGRPKSDLIGLKQQ